MACTIGAFIGCDPRVAWLGVRSREHYVRARVHVCTCVSVCVTQAIFEGQEHEYLESSTAWADHMEMRKRLKGLIHLEDTALAKEMASSRLVLSGSQAAAGSGKCTQHTSLSISQQTVLKMVALCMTMRACVCVCVSGSGTQPRPSQEGVATYVGEQRGFFQRPRDVPKQNNGGGPSQPYGRSPYSQGQSYGQGQKRSRENDRCYKCGNTGEWGHTGCARDTPKHVATVHVACSNGCACAYFALRRMCRQVLSVHVCGRVCSQATGQVSAPASMAGEGPTPIDLQESRLLACAARSTQPVWKCAVALLACRR